MPLASGAQRCFDVSRQIILRLSSDAKNTTFGSTIVALPRRLAMSSVSTAAVVVNMSFSMAYMQVVAELFGLDPDFANLSLGGLTIACALLGILGGGQLPHFRSQLCCINWCYELGHA